MFRNSNAAAASPSGSPTTSPQSATSTQQERTDHENRHDQDGESKQLLACQCLEGEEHDDGFDGDGVDFPPWRNQDDREDDQHHRGTDGRPDRENPPPAPRLGWEWDPTVTQVIVRTCD